MLGQRIGYVRVSTSEQYPDRQLDNVAVDRTFTEKASGKDARRPQLAPDPTKWETEVAIRVAGNQPR